MPNTPDNNIVIAVLRTIDTKIDRAVDDGEAERQGVEIALPDAVGAGGPHGPAGVDRVAECDRSGHFRALRPVCSWTTKRLHNLTNPLSADAPGPAHYRLTR